MTIASLIVQVAANTVQLQQDVQKITSTLDSVTGVAGRIAPALAGAFTVTAVAAYAREIIDLGGHLVDLRDKTGINVEALQVLGRAADLSGNSLEQVTGAISQMQKRLAGGDAGAVGALRQLNLSLTELRNLTPDQQFRTIARAIADTEDPAQRTRLAFELFGKSGAEILPTLVSNIDAVANSTVAMSSRSAEALDKLGDAWTATIGNVKGFTGNAIADIIESFSSWQGAMEGLQMASGNMAGRLDRDLRLFQEESMRAAASFKEIAPAMNAAFQVPTIDQALGAYKALAEEQKKTADEHKKAAEKHAAAAKKAQDAQDAWLKSVDATTVKMGLSVFYLGKWGATMPVVTSAINEDRDALLAWRPEIEAVTTEAYDWAAAHQRVVSVLQQQMQLLVQMPERTRTAAEAFRAGGDSAGTGFFGGLQRGLSNIPAFFGNLQSSLSTTLAGMFGAGPNSVLSSVISGGLNFVFGPLSGLATQLIQKGMAALGKKVWEGLQKIGGFFRDMFGGPSADELAGRDIVNAFENNLSEMLNDQQRIEAGGEGWKETVIAIRDKYMALGLTEAEALEDAKRLWESSKQGAEAAKRVIEEIKRKFEGGIRIPVTLPVTTPGGDSPVEPMAAGGYGRTTRPRLFLVGENGPEDYAFSGSGRRFATGAGGEGGGDIINNVYIDGELVARSVTKRQSRDLRSRRKLAAA